jgi:hypothetical protein
MRFKALTAAVLCLAAAPAVAGRTGPWTKEQAWKWYKEQPLIRGCNYMPASAANRMDMWQEFGSEARFEEMDRELALAASIGFNTVRVLLEENGFGAWYYEHDDFMKNFEKFLSLCKKHGIRAIVGLGNDCSRPKPLWSLPKPGPQPCDWGYHGARKQSQHGSFPGMMGYTSLDDPELRPKFFRMCEEIMTKYRDDDRILFWNIWNEPGANRREEVTVANLREMFALAWKIGVKQPCAADVWTDDFGTDAKAKNQAQYWAGKLSDIVSYHCYGDYEYQICVIRKLKRYYDRPMVNTEWLARIKNNDVFSAYPLFYIENVGCTCWGFVAGRYQTYEPWESMWRSYDEGHPATKDWDMTKWFHDLFRPSHRPYAPKEISLIKRFNARADDDFRLDHQK